MKTKTNNISIKKASFIFLVLVCSLISIFPHKFGLRSDGEFLIFSCIKLSRTRVLIYSVYCFVFLFFKKKLITYFRLFLNKQKTYFKKLNVGERIIYFIYFLFAIIYLRFLLNANIDLLNPDFITIEEQTSFLRIKQQYLNPIKFLICNDTRYGILMWNVPALISYIPYQFFGDKVLVLLPRLINSTILFFSYFILVQTFIKLPINRVLAMIFLLTLPFTQYYATNVKPEPIQLFFIATALYVTDRKNIHHHLYWFCLGIALGMKISFLPFILVVSTSYFLVHKSIKVLKNISICILGYVIAFPQIFLIGSPFNLISITRNNASLHPGVHHQPSVEIIDRPVRWINFIINNYFWEQEVLGYIFLLAVLAGAIIIMTKQFKKKKFILDSETLLLLKALFITFPITLIVIRLWGFYLHLGFVLFVICFFVGFEKMKKNNISIIICLIIIPFFSSNTFFYKTKQTNPVVKLIGYEQLAKRTKSKSFINLKKIKKYLEVYFHNVGGQNKVWIAPSLFTMNSTKSVYFERYFGSVVSKLSQSELNFYQYIVITNKEKKDIQAIYSKYKSYYYEVKTKNNISETIKIFKLKDTVKLHEYVRNKKK